MKRATRKAVSRRQFLLTSTSVAVGASILPALRAEEPGAAPAPRATAGDRLEPDWQQRLTISVGPKDADLVGTSDKVLQAAVDFVARQGGGTVRVLPGTYRLRNAVYLASHVRIVGSGDDSVLIKEPSAAAKLAEDSDWFDQEITLEDASGFGVGDGVCLRATNPHTGGPTVCKRTLIAQSGNRFKLDRALRENFWQLGEATAATLFPLVGGENLADVTIENIVLDGNRANNDVLDGNYAGCIFLQDCRDIAIRGVTARHYNGDGISWQICHDVVVEGCRSHDHAGLGLHPGSGSQRPIIRGNQLERNEIGIFFCWGVKGGLAQGNKVVDSRAAGVSIGHRDTNNVIRDNEILRSGQVGVLFRPERGRNFAPHRNLLEGNRIVDSGPPDGAAVDVQGETESVTIRGNEIRETRQPMQRVGIRIGAATSDIRVADNRIEGFATAVADLRTAKT